jgi:nudix-type nucleoside diphosphatase (YffH/AdpP family)
MSLPRRVDIRKQSCLFDDFFKINELVVSHERADGTMSPEQRRLIFERGDSAAVLLFNRDSRQLVLVKQFKAPTLGKGHENGWITETVAGMIDRYETSRAAAIRESMEETGYKIGELTEIATFFSSPGGSSERIFLYYAEVGDADRLGKGGGDADEDIEVQQIPVDELLEELQHKSLEDPKLIISALWLKEELSRQTHRPLNHATVKYALVQHPELFIGYKTGPIADIKGIGIWVNSENEDMIMDRFIGRSISANIRYLGADKDRSNNVTEDIITEECGGSASACSGRRGD